MEREPPVFKLYLSAVIHINNFWIPKSLEKIKKKKLSEKTSGKSQEIFMLMDDL